MLSFVGQADLTSSDVAAIQAVLVETGAVSEIETTIDRLTAYAIAADRTDADHPRCRGTRSSSSRTTSPGATDSRAASRPTHHRSGAREDDL